MSGGLGERSRQVYLSLRERIIGLPLMREELLPGLPGRGAGVRPKDHRQPRREMPEERDHDDREQSEAEPFPLQFEGAPTHDVYSDP